MCLCGIIVGVREFFMYRSKETFRMAAGDNCDSVRRSFLWDFTCEIWTYLCTFLYICRSSALISVSSPVTVLHEMKNGCIAAKMAFVQSENTGRCAGLSLNFVTM